MTGSHDEDGDRTGRHHDHHDARYGPGADDIEAAVPIAASSAASSHSSSSSGGTSSTTTTGGRSGGGRSDDSLSRISTSVSLGPDNPVAPTITSVVDVPDEFYDRMSARRKFVIVALLSFCSFLSPISSTAVLAATPEVAATYGSTGSVVDLTNALYMLFMGISPIFWGPVSEVYGRRVVSCVLDHVVSSHTRA